MMEVIYAARPVLGSLVVFSCAYLLKHKMCNYTVTTRLLHSFLLGVGVVLYFVNCPLQGNIPLLFTCFSILCNSMLDIIYMVDEANAEVIKGWKNFTSTIIVHTSFGASLMLSLCSGSASLRETLALCATVAPLVGILQGILHHYVTTYLTTYLRVGGDSLQDGLSNIIGAVAGVTASLFFLSMLEYSEVNALG